MIFSRCLHTAGIFISFEWQKGLFGDLDTWLVLNPHVVCDPLLVNLPRENGHPGCCSSQAAQPWAHPPRFVGFGCACFRCMDSQKFDHQKTTISPTMVSLHQTPQNVQEFRLQGKISGSSSMSKKKSSAKPAVTSTTTTTTTIMTTSSDNNHFHWSQGTLSSLPPCLASPLLNPEMHVEAGHVCEEEFYHYKWWEHGTS